MFNKYVGNYFEENRDDEWNSSGDDDEKGKKKTAEKNVEKKEDPRIEIPIEGKKTSLGAVLVVNEVTNMALREAINNVDGDVEIADGRDLYDKLLDFFNNYLRKKKD